MPRAERIRASAAGLALVLLAGCATGSGPAASGPTPPGAGFEPLRTAAPGAEPTRLRIPSIGVDAPVEPLGRAADGTVEVPRAWEVVGWYRDGARPGDPGPAVLLGHVDSRRGPAVFARVPSLAPGDVVEVAGAGSAPVRFEVERVERFPKTAFPTEAVYLPTLRPELRLVTCGGRFDRSTGHYVDNVVAFAVATG